MGSVAFGFFVGKLDYKSVANLPIRVSQILYLILLIFEIIERTF